jgi:hypothetical protein
MTDLVRTVAAAAALSLLAAPAYAQNLNTSAPGSYGQVTLNSGFTPDPHNVSVNAGGPIDVSSVRDECTGYVTARASYTLRYRQAGELPLYIGAVSDADTTIVVRAPDGSWHCDDDSAGNLNPLVSWEDPRNGRYQIWVGRFAVEGETAPAMLHISEIGGPQQQAAAGGPDFTLDPAYGSIDLASGFMPDPHTQAIAAGGSIDAATAISTPGCLGWIAQAPDYRVNWTAGSGSLPLIFSVTSAADTTLVINDAQGNWLCDDDGGNEGLNPAITIQSPASGQYDIWVGTYAQGDLQDSTLHVSELHSQ